MVDAIAERVLEAALLDGTAVADTTGDFDTHAIGRKKCVRGVGGAISYCHPTGVHLDLLGFGPLAECPLSYRYYAQIEGKVPVKPQSARNYHRLKLISRTEWLPIEEDT